MATGSQPDSVFYGLYDEYMGEARTKPEVYGYWVLVIGLLAVLAGVVVFATGRTGLLGLGPVAVTELALVFVAAGGPLFLLGAILQLPLRRRAVPVAVLGALASVASSPSSGIVGDVASTSGISAPSASAAVASSSSRMNSVLVAPGSWWPTDRQPR